MSSPEQALEHARAAAEEMRASGAYQADTEARPAPSSASADEQTLRRWALLDPDISGVRSTRRLGAPVTALKRTLLRLLGQYHQELIAQQTRFNVAVLERVAELERRLDDLEADRERRQ